MIGIAYLGRFVEDAVMYPRQLLRSLGASDRDEGAEIVDRSNQAGLGPHRWGGRV